MLKAGVLEYTCAAVRTKKRQTHRKRSGDDLIRQLRRSLSSLPLDRPDQPGLVRYVFPWSSTFVARASRTPSSIKYICTRSIDVALRPCPIYKRLSPHARHELILRAPKGFLRYRSFRWGLLQSALDAYEASELRGVSPVTAMGLLCPEPRNEIHSNGISPILVIPETNASPRSLEWPVVVWAIKRYCNVSWTDVCSLASDMNRRPTSLRQTIRRNVEEPLAAFYLDLTGEKLNKELHSAALFEDGSSSTPRSRERMKELKRAAKAKRATTIE